MPENYDDFVFPDPWWDLRGNGYRESEERERLVRRLVAEVGRGHAVATRGLEAVAAFTRQDEVLYRIDEGVEFVIAHLTYTSTPPDPFIGLRFFTSWEDAAEMVHEMADEW